MKRFFSLFLALLCMLGTIVPAEANQLTPETRSPLGPGEWWGYTDGSKYTAQGFPEEIHVVQSNADRPDQSGSGLNDHIGYCYNASRFYPADTNHTNITTKYKESPAMMPVVRGILLAGYPNDMTNFKKRMGDKFTQGYQAWLPTLRPASSIKPSQDDYFRALTQFAVWYVRGASDGGVGESDLKKLHIKDPITWELMMELVKYGEAHALDAPVNGIPPILKENGIAVNKDNPLILGDNGESEVFTVGKNYKISVELPVSDQYTVVDAATGEQVYFLEPGGKYRVKVSAPVAEGQEIRVNMVRVSEMEITNFVPVEINPASGTVGDYQNIVSATYKKDQNSFPLVKKSNKVKAEFKKVDENSAFLPGAKIKVTDKETGTVVKEFTSTGDKVIIENLEPGKTYVIEEVEAPEGYEIAANIEFTVSQDGKVQITSGEKLDGNIITMVDKKEQPKEKEVIVSKVDAANKEELAGAKLEVKDSEGNVVESWTSDGSEHKFNVEINKEYTLTEKSAPDGYEVAEDITFKVDENGQVFVKENGNWVKADKVVMVDEREIPWTPIKPSTPVKSEVIFSKTEVDGTTEVIGAHLQVTDENGNVVESWVSDGSDHKIKLEVGHEYTMTETQAPNGYLIAESIKFRVNVDGTVDVYENGKWVNKADKTVHMIDYRAKKDEKPSKPGKPGKTNTTVKQNHFAGVNTGDATDMGAMALMALISLGFAFVLRKKQA